MSKAARNASRFRKMISQLSRPTPYFSKTLENLAAAFGTFAAWYNYCWQTQKAGNRGKLRPTAAMMAGLAVHVWLFDAVLA